VNVRQRIPGEEDSEQDEVAPMPGVQPPQQEKEEQRQEGSPLELDVWNLREAPGHEREDETGEERGCGIPGHLAGERPRRHRRQEHPQEKKKVVDEQGRCARGEQREAEERRAPQVLGEREGVTRGMKDVRVEEVERVMERLVVVPVKNPGVQLRVPEVAEAAPHPHGLRPREKNRSGEEDRGGPDGLSGAGRTERRSSAGRRSRFVQPRRV
jgi:hypothetical protein